VVECDLAKVDVAGSNPVSRSKIQREKAGSSAAPPAFCFGGHDGGDVKRETEIDLVARLLAHVDALGVPLLVVRDRVTAAPRRGARR
jgi:hypothetical protein